jgi:putative transposase
MDEAQCLSHSKWECKYPVVYIPKCRRKTLYEKLRPPIWAKCSAS